MLIISSALVKKYIHLGIKNYSIFICTYYAGNYLTQLDWHLEGHPASKNSHYTTLTSTTTTVVNTTRSSCGWSRETIAATIASFNRVS